MAKKVPEKLLHVYRRYGQPQYVVNTMTPKQAYAFFKGKGRRHYIGHAPLSNGSTEGAESLIKLHKICPHLNLLAVLRDLVPIIEYKA